MRTTHLTGWLIGLAVGALLAWMVIGCGSGDDSRAPSSWTFTAPTPTSHLGAAPPTIAAPTPTWTGVESDVVAGATYQGRSRSQMTGGRVEFAVAADGKNLTYFSFTDVDCEKENSTVTATLTELIPIVGDKFDIADASDGYHISGSFHSGATAEGSLSLYPWADTDPCTVDSMFWNASNDEVVTPPPAPAENEVTTITDLDGTVVSRISTGPNPCKPLADLGMTSCTDLGDVCICNGSE